MKTDSSGSSSSIQLLDSAPDALVSLYKARPNFPGRPILGRLLSDSKMSRPWRILGKHISSRREWEALWREIACARHAARLDSQLYPPNQKMRTKYKNQLVKLADDVEEIANQIDGSSLDLPAYHLFPDEVMRIFGIKDWPTRDRLQRADAAARVLPEWPTVPELLRELSGLAKQSADKAIVNKGPVSNTTQAREARYFASTLTAYLNYKYSVHLYGTVANITAVVLGCTVTKKQVENVVKGSQ